MKIKKIVEFLVNNKDLVVKLVLTFIAGLGMAFGITSCKSFDFTCEGSWCLTKKVS